MREHKEYKENSKILAGDGEEVLHLCFKIPFPQKQHYTVITYVTIMYYICNNYVKLGSLTDSLIQTTARNKQ